MSSHSEAWATTDGSPADTATKMLSPRRPRRRRACQRRGVAALWLILVLPVLVLLLGLVIEIGNIWRARVELENALEAAALAAVKQWGDGGGGDTQLARNVAIAYAAANTVTGTPVVITDNYLDPPPAGFENQNAAGTGNLIFGASTADTIPWVFDADEQPACGGGTVLFDVTGLGNLKEGNNRWGIAFRRTADAVLNNLQIEWVEIDLSGIGLVFDLNGGPPAGSSNTTTGGAVDGGSYDQPDIGGFSFGTLPPPSGTTIVGAPGFTAPNTQISFVPTNGTPTVLKINFSADGTNDLGFEPGDRFRFGASAGTVLGGGNIQQANGDDIAGARIRVKFVGLPFESTGAYVDDTNAQISNCGAGVLDATGEGQLVVHISGEADLPCTASSSQTNNGQSWVELRGGSGRDYGVRAQASVPVNSVCCRLFGATTGVFTVSACATARYTCANQVPELIRVRPENYDPPGTP